MSGESRGERRAVEDPGSFDAAVIRHEGASSESCSVRLSGIPPNNFNSKGQMICDKDQIEPLGEGPLGLSVRDLFFRHGAASLVKASDHPDRNFGLSHPAAFSGSYRQQLSLRRFALLQR